MTTVTQSNQKKFSNWLQCVQALDDTKKALHIYVFNIWKCALMTWAQEERNSIPTFINCVWNGKMRFKDNHRTWEANCGHVHCSTILSKLLFLQQNKGKTIVWESKLCDLIINDGLSEVANDAYRVEGHDNILKVTAFKFLELLKALLFPLFDLNIERPISNDTRIELDSIFEGCRKEHIWCIANLFMHRGKVKLNIQTTGPENTDVAMFFRMMKNCTLFDLDENYLYDNILLCRDKLHHSSDNRIDHKDAETYFTYFTKLLQKFNGVPTIQATVDNIERMRQETIVAVAMPDDNIREMAKLFLPLKVATLKVDEATEEDMGLSTEDTHYLIEATELEIDNASSQDTPLNQVMSREELKKECDMSTQMLNKLRKELQEKEVETELLKRQLEEINDGRVIIEGNYEEQINDSNDHEQDNNNVETSNTHGQEEDEEAINEDNSHEHGNIEEIPNTGNGQRQETFLPLAVVNGKTTLKEKFETMSQVLTRNLENPVIVEGVTQQLMPVMDACLVAASRNDPDFVVKVNAFLEHQSQTADLERARCNSRSTACQTDAVTELCMMGDRYQETLQRTTTVTASRSPSSYWSATSKARYNIKSDEDKYPCKSCSCYQLPSGETIIVDGQNKKLKKLNSKYEVIKICELKIEPCDICCLGNSKAIVSVFSRQLLFIDTENFSVMGRVATNQMYRGLACHGNRLYATDYRKIYLLTTDGILRQTLYDMIDAESGVKQHIAVSNDGSKLYITTWKKTLITLDRYGNHLFTLTNEELSGPCAVCVDDKGDVFVSNRNTLRVLQISSDGGQIIKTVASFFEEHERPLSICFDNKTSTLICANTTSNITVIKLERITTI